MEFEYKNIKIFYELDGKGNPLVLVHGWGGTTESLKKLSRFAKYDYRTTLVDLPGFGKSDPPPQGWGVEEYANVVIKVLEKVGNGNKVDYFGHSFGGGIGVYIAAVRPDLIKNLILCGAAVVREPKVARSVRIAQKYIPGYEKIKEVAHPVKRLIYKTAFPDSDSLKHPHVEASFRKVIQEDLQSYLPKVKCSTLILWGDEDKYTPLDYGMKIKNGIKNSEMKVFQGYGHNLPLVNPAEVFSTIDNFLTAKK